MPAVVAAFFEVDFVWQDRQVPACIYPFSTNMPLKKSTSIEACIVHIMVVGRFSISLDTSMDILSFGSLCESLVFIFGFDS